MIPLSCRLLVGIASLLVPGPRRSEWRREWQAELWHRAASGASTAELWHHARGVFRDAAWFLESERKEHGSDLFRKPLRMEAIFLSFGILACLYSGVFRAPRLPYRDAGRLVLFERNIAFAGSINPSVNPRLLPVWSQGPSFSELAPYRILREPELTLHVGPTFFDVLGAKPLMGRTFRATDPSDAAVIPFDVWRTNLHSDPHAIGRPVAIGTRVYTVIGIMPSDFWFRTKDVRVFAPLGRWIHAGSIVARLKPGVKIAAARKDIRLLARKVETRWISDGYDLVPLLEDSRLRSLSFALGLSAIAAVLSMVFLLFKGFAKWRYWVLILGARVFFVVLSMALLRISLYPLGPVGQLTYSLFVFWIFLLACSGAACLLVIDHRGRCPVCVARLRKPVPIGSWSSQVLDQPATEYLCPSGHGTLYIAETGNAPDCWTVLDESWQEFFVHNAR